MGRLHRIELENFKSYKGRQTIGPFHDFTCVIGPNGAGKSNLMDAISFVLGVKSSHLRSSQLRELIYRDRVEESQTGTAESSKRGATAGSSRGVTAGSDADPRKAWVMAVYIDSNGNEVHFTRSVNMAGVSEYKINNKVMLYADYDKQLQKYNILVKARNFLVFQGDVEAIASQSPKDLTRLLEQISGSLELKQEYDRLQLEQERAVENSTFNFQKKKGINAEIKQYQEQKVEAERYESLEEEKANLTVQYLLWKLFHIERNITETEAAILEKTDLLEPTQEQFNSAEQELTDAKKELAVAQRDTFRKERSIVKREKAITELNPEVLSLEEKISHVTKKLKTIQANGIAVQETHAKQSQIVTTLESELASVERMADKFEENAQAQEEARGGVTMSAEDQTEYWNKKEEVARRTVVQSQQLGQLRRNIKGQKAENRKLLDEVEELKQKRTKLLEQQEQLTDHQQKVEAHLANTLQEQGRVQQEIQNLSNERIRIEKSEVELNEKLTSVLNQLMEAKLDQRETEKEQKLKEMLKSLKRIFPGVHGRVTDLCKPTQRKYDTAIAVILGRHMDAIVVDREKTAIECIQFLREQRSGHATFLPLDTLVVKPVNDRLRGLAKGSRLAVDVVQYDGMLERAIQYVCGNTLVCDSMDVAKHICYELGQKVKAVSLDGTVFHKSGLITGGQSGVGTGARRWEEAAVDELKRRRDTILQQLNELAKSKKRGMPEESLKSELAGIESKLTFAREDLSATRRKLNGVREEMQVVDAALTEKTPLADQSTRELAEQQLQISAVEAVVHRVEDEVFGSFCARIGITTIREYEEQKLKRQQELAEERSRYETLLSKLRNRLSFESLQLMETNERLARLESAVQAETQRLDEFERERDELQASQADIRKEIRALQRELEQAQQRTQAKSGLVAQLKKQVARANKSVDQLLRDIGTKESLVEKLDSERASILRRCKLEQIEIPMLKGTLDDISMEDIDSIRRTSGGNDKDMDVDQGSQQRRVSQTPKSQEWAIVIDFSDLDADLRQALPTMAELSSSQGGSSTQDNAATSAMQRLSLTQSQASQLDTHMAEPDAPDGTMEKVENDLLDRLKKLADEMERLAPSLRALERQDDIEARLRQTDRDFSAARRSAKTIKEAFSAVKQERYERFHRAFTHISERIDVIYKELTRSTAFPMGGTAYLSLEDTEEPYLSGVRYHAMPPLKRFRDMDQLSGGEKTMAALALLFAIHSYRPSPFFVLDEVDAALDNMNVARIGHYLQQHASVNLQFIVISLKASLYERGQSLVGIYRDQEVNSSKTLTLKLDSYDE